MNDSLSRPPPQSEPATTIGEEERSELALIAIGWALMISKLAAKTAASTSVTNAWRGAALGEGKGEAQISSRFLYLPLFTFFPRQFVQISTPPNFFLPHLCHTE